MEITTEPNGMNIRLEASEFADFAEVLQFAKKEMPVYRKSKWWKELMGLVEKMNERQGHEA